MFAVVRVVAELAGVARAAGGQVTETPSFNAPYRAFGAVFSFPDSSRSLRATVPQV